MKKYLLSALFMLSVSAIFAQEASDFGKNRFSLGAAFSSYSVKDADYTANGFSSPINYERIFGESGNLGLQVGLNMDFLAYDSDYKEAIYTFDTALNWYITGQGKGFYLSPTIKLGAVVWNNGYDTGSEQYTSLGINAGYQIQISKLFGINPYMGYDVVKVGESDFGDIGVFRVGVAANFSF